MSLPPGHAETRGQRLGQYELVELLGRGGMASVFRGWQPALERWVAVKVLRADLAADPDFVRRFEHEARIQARLSHPHVVPIYEVGQAEGTYYIAMQYVPKGTLAQSIQHSGALSLERTLKLLGQIAEALDHAHKQGVIHRDLKPGNVLLDADDWISLGDFGIARASEVTTRLTRVGAVAGTAAYMAPEQARKDSEIDYRADLYALGVMAYEMLTGRVPFTATTDVAMLHAHIYDPPPPIATLRPDLPERLGDVLEIMLAKTPAQRFDSAAAFVNALGGGAQHVPSTIAETAETAETVIRPTVDTLPSGATVSATGRSGPGLRPIVAGALAVLLFVVGYALFTRSLPPPPVPTLQPTPPVATPVPQNTPPIVNPPVATTPPPTNQCREELARIDPLWGSDWAGVISILEASRARDPGCADVPDKLYAAYLNQATALVAQDQTDLALASLDKAVVLQPGRSEAATQRRQMQLYRDGLSARRSGDLDTAVARLSDLVKADRDYAGGRAFSTLRAVDDELAQRVKTPTPSVAKPPVQPTAVPTVAPAPFWTVIVASELQRAMADAAAQQLRKSGNEGAVLFSSDYSSLNPGYWVAYSGRYATKAQADEHSYDLKAQGFAIAYPREVRR